jgi:hypothetical protein
MGMTDDSGALEPHLHEAAGIQTYAARIGRIADEIARDAELTEQIIAAVHAEQPADIERLFAERGVESVVTIVPEPATGPGAPGTLSPRDRQTKTVTVTVTVGIGPISISVTVTKKK